MFCHTIFNRGDFSTYVGIWAMHHRSLLKVLTLLLGFYVSAMLGRWWKQITDLPNVSSVAMTMNALVMPGEWNLSIHAVDF